MHRRWTHTSNSCVYVELCEYHTRHENRGGGIYFQTKITDENHELLSCGYRHESFLVKDYLVTKCIILTMYYFPFIDACNNSLVTRL